MLLHRIGSACALLLLLPALALAETPPLVARAQLRDISEERTVRELAAEIDKHLGASWSARQIKPAPQAEDAEFLRRITLDLIGRIPKVAEIRAFEEDKSPTKRAAIVLKLLQSPMHASHWASITRNAWLPETLTDIQTAYMGQQYEDWLRKRFAENMPLDEIVHKTITADVQVGQRGRVQFNRGISYDADTAGLAAFYQANMVKPENLGSTVSRTFLGVKLECAQCHDHPFAPYKRTQFWEFAAFFAEFTPLPPLPPNFIGPVQPQTDKNMLTITGTNRTVTAQFMDGTSPSWSKERSPRQELAEWMTDRKNPYFAKNMANRLWAEFFGIGLIDPIDEPGDNNPPSHPELLNALARGLIAAKYDQRIIIRAIVASQAYNLTSKLTHPSQSDVRSFARMNMKGLTGNTIYESFATATGVRDNTPRNQRYYDPYNRNARGLFNNMFPSSNRPTEQQTSILQALLMMNSKFVADQTSIEKSDTLAAIIDAPFMDTEKKIDTLFLSALSRKATAEERERFTSYVDRGGPSENKAKALTDVFWVLLNSTEFMFNH